MFDYLVDDEFDHSKYSSMILSFLDDNSSNSLWIFRV